MVDVELRVHEEVGVPRANEIVRCGVPFPPGALRDPDDHAVFVSEVANGRPRAEMPVRSQVLWSQHDRAGWVRWLGLAFPVSVSPLGVVSARARAGARPRAADAADAPAVSVDHLPEGGVRVSTGAVTGGIGLTPFSLSGDGLAAAVVSLGGANGVRHYADVSPDTLVVRHAGPLVAQVEFAGRYGPPDESWRFTGRVTARAGARSLDLEVGLVNDADEPEAEVGEWAVEFDTGPIESGDCGVFGAVHRSAPPFAVRHRGDGHPRGIFATSHVAGGDDWLHVGDDDYLDRWEWAELHGRHAANWVVAHATDGGDVTVAVHRFAENHPSDLAVEAAGVTARLWPGDAGPLQLTQGAAKTRALRLTHGADRLAGAALDCPLVAAPSATGGAVDGVAGWLPYLPERYPNLEAHIREELSGWYQSGQSLGFHDFGDSVQGITVGPRTGYSANNEHDALLALGLHYLRSGERVYYDSAQAYADHLCDIDLIHHSVFPHEIGGLRAHGHAHVHYVEARTPAGWVRTSIDTGHLWTEGLVLFGRLSGDERYLDAARQVADCIVGLVDFEWARPEPGPRNSGWPLIALTAVARATGDDKYLAAALAIAKGAVAAQRPDGRWLMRLGLVDDYCAWQNAVLLVGLARLRSLEENSEVKTAFRTGAQALLDLGRNPDGTFVYLNRFDYRWANRSALIREALALAFDATGDDRFLRAGLAGGARWYRPRGAAPALSNDVAEWRGHLPFLGRAHDAGLLTDLPDAG